MNARDGTRNAQTMQWLGWLRNRLADNDDASVPAMLRVRDARGRVVSLVELDGVYEPGGQRIRKTQVTASGLCLLQWPVRSERLRLEVRASDGQATVEIASRRDNPERVIEVRLT
jgi:hypothetical protein